MNKTLPSFASLLGSLLLEERLTPTRLAREAGVTTASVEAWLGGWQIPRSDSVWKVATVLSRDRERLFAAAALATHSRMEVTLNSANPLRWDKSLSTFMSAALDRLKGDDAAALTKIWSEMLTSPPILSSSSTKPPISELICLPEPSIRMVGDWEQMTRELAHQRLNLAELPWKRFEDLIAHLLERNGWEVQPMGYTKDDGIDLIAVTTLRPDVKISMMVQCKRSAERRKVGVELVREVWAVKLEHQFHQAMLATTSTFTRGARQKGELWDLALRDQEAIISWCKRLEQ